jgi:hypothetical protein
VCAKLARHTLDTGANRICHKQPFGTGAIGRALIIAQGDFKISGQIDALMA